ncbi:MAG: alpha/beta fold hydrolase, partial [Longimicrobiales bacterium]
MRQPITARLATACIAVASVLAFARAAAAQETDPREGSFQANGLRLHFVEWGAPTAQPIILLHHINTHARTWDAFARRMSADYRVVALDMRGHGDSQWAPAGKYTT